MAEIILAKSAGFCFGVNRAIKLVTELAKSGKKVATLGPIIHNKTMVEQLEQQGIRIAESPADRQDNEVMVIRTHGVCEKTYAQVVDGGEFADATCPRVTKIHNIVSDASKQGRTVLIAGDCNHPEVLGIAGRISSDYYVYDDIDTLEKLLKEHTEFGQIPITAVCQTTYNALNWTKCQELIKKVCTNAIIFDTICKATSLRQREAADLAQKCDIMIVIGSKNSSNTTKLYEICKGYCEKTYFVEHLSELPVNEIKSADIIGVTAGASTPPVIIKEVLITMSEITNTAEVNTAADEKVEKSFDEMTFEEALEASLANLNSDQKVKGTVLSVSPTEIQVDIGRKQTGFIPYREFSSDQTIDLTKAVKVGDELDLIVMRTNDQEGIITLSKRRYDAIAGWDKIVEAKENGTVLEGKVTEINKGGMVVSYEGFRVFIPASQATLNKVDSLDELKGTEVKFRIIEINRGRRAIGSVRSVLREERKAAQTEFWDNVEVGQRLTGTVKTLTTYGAFVDLGGVDGMIHISELSWARIKHPSEVVSVGDTVEVTVKEVDTEKHKISLGFKKDEDNPWTVLAKDYPIGTVVKAKIVNMTDYGAFARIIPGIDGLIHISQIAHEHINKPGDVLKNGQEVDAKITDVDFNKKRVSLSIKALLEPVAPQEEEAPAESTEVAEEAPEAAQTEESAE